MVKLEEVAESLIAHKLITSTTGSVSDRAKRKMENAGKEAYGKIYKNGAPVGTERINGTTSLVTYTEDLSFANGDVIELYAYNAEDFLMETYVSNFRVKGVAHANTLQDALTDTHVGVTTPFEGTNS